MKKSWVRLFSTMLLCGSMAIYSCNNKEENDPQKEEQNSQNNQNNQKPSDGSSDKENTDTSTDTHTNPPTGEDGKTDENHHQDGESDNPGSDNENTDHEDDTPVKCGDTFCGANSKCQSGFCYCLDGYVQNENNDGCVAKPTTSPDDAECQAFAQNCGSHGYCSQGECICDEGYTHAADGYFCIESTYFPKECIGMVCGQNSHCHRPNDSTEIQCICDKGYTTLDDGSSACVNEKQVKCHYEEDTLVPHGKYVADAIITLHYDYKNGWEENWWTCPIECDEGYTLDSTEENCVAVVPGYNDELQ